MSKVGIIGMSTVTVGAAITMILSMFGVVNWLDFLYVLSYIKLGLTIVKYIPQVYMNYVRKSTTGWSIINVMLDFAGGVFSIMQLLLDSWISGDWSGIMGFLIKMALGVVTLVFDTIFLLQHYVWFADSTHPTILEVVDMEMKEVSLEGEEDELEKLKNGEKVPRSPISERLIQMEENHNELKSEDVYKTREDVDGTRDRFIL